MDYWDDELEELYLLSQPKAKQPLVNRAFCLAMAACCFFWVGVGLLIWWRW